MPTPLLPPPVLVPPPSTPLEFPFDPPLSPRYSIRFLQASDRAVCVRLISHSFMYHNPVDVAYRRPSSGYDAVTAMIFDHCLPHHLSFAIVDNEYRAKQGRQEADAASSSSAPSPHERVDHDADRDADVLDTPVAGVIINHDACWRVDWSALRSSPTPSPMADTFALFAQLRAHDLRKEPSHPFHSLYSDPPVDTQWPAGEHLHVFLLATRCAYKGERLASYLCQASYYWARQMGFESLHTEASHPATAHIFMKAPINGVVTHRYAPRELVSTGEDGKEYRRWEGAEEDVVAVHASIDQALTFSLLPFPMSLTHLPPSSPLPTWLSPEFSSVTLTRAELSVLTLTECTPTDLPSAPPSDPSALSSASFSVPGYRVLSIRGPLVLSLIGVMLRVVRPLARGRVSVLAVSSYDTDAVAVREEDVDTAIRLLELQGHTVKHQPRSSAASHSHTSPHTNGTGPQQGSRSPVIMSSD